VTDFWIKENDTEPAIEAYLEDENGNAIDLSSVFTIRFHMADAATNTIKVNEVADVINATTGRVRYRWQSGDTDIPDAYSGEFEVTWETGDIETFPNYTNIEIEIVPELA